MSNFARTLCNFRISTGNLFPDTYLLLSFETLESCLSFLRINYFQLMKLLADFLQFTDLIILLKILEPRVHVASNKEHISSFPLVVVFLSER